MRAAAKAGARAKAKAKAKALAIRQGLNVRLEARRTALRDLNALLDDLPVPCAKVDVKRVDVACFERLLRILNHRCVEDAARARLRAAVRKYVDNGGNLPDGLRLRDGEVEDTQGSAAAPVTPETPLLAKHTVLQGDFRLQSRAFMLTFNSRLFTPGTWPPFLDWVKAIAQRYRARAWSACLEKSENSSQEQPGQPVRFHTHAYLEWEDDLGIDLPR